MHMYEAEKCTLCVSHCLNCTLDFNISLLHNMPGFFLHSMWPNYAQNDHIINLPLAIQYNTKKNAFYAWLLIFLDKYSVAQWVLPINLFNDAIGEHTMQTSTSNLANCHRCPPPELPQRSGKRNQWPTMISLGVSMILWLHPYCTFTERSYAHPTSYHARFTTAILKYPGNVCVSTCLTFKTDTLVVKSCNHLWIAFPRPAFLQQQNATTEDS